MPGCKRCDPRVEQVDRQGLQVVSWKQRTAEVSHSDKRTSHFGEVSALEVEVLFSRRLIQV
jgi:hypothetical protein